MAPVENHSEPVRLQVQRNGAWKTVASSAIDPLARTATFRVPKWPSKEDVRYRAAYNLNGEHFLEGIVRRDPVDKPKIVVASLSCLNDFGFPHSDLLSSVQHFKPDFAAFQGDQIYERCAGYGIQRFPLETATLDYLRKWYLFGWSFRDIMRDMPTICMTDDHDVYHGNLWGAGGRHAEGLGQDGQDSGGYIEPATWVNMMQRTQTSHLPDPYDPTPVEQNIAVYYTELRWGGISFAILEDRKWKSAPKIKIPFARIKNGWAQNPDYNAARDGDVAGAELLGPRQLSFLDHWAQDWSGGTWLKVALSQTLLANIATLPPHANTDAVVPHLPILKTGSYPEDDVLVADHDSNGWPQSGRNRALEALRKCAALHLSGDQHLGSTVQYGVNDWGDAAFGVCSPALSNIFPRRWYPPHPGKNSLRYEPKNAGDYIDGFGNKITIHAVFNPEQADAEPNPLMDRSPGIAVIEFDRGDLSANVSVWARRVDPQSEGAKPVKGWPVRIQQLDNGWARTLWVLPPVHGEGRRNFGVQVKSEANNKIVYTLRVKGDSFTPPVGREGAYSVRVFDPDGRYEKVYRGMKAEKR
jgi:alkaline phosphatase D